MDTPHLPPLGLIARLIRWSRDAALMPTRIRALADAAASARDPRLVCGNCGYGRIGQVVTLETGMSPVIHGRCDNPNCRMLWRIGKGMNALMYPVMDQGTPPSE